MKRIAPFVLVLLIATAIAFDEARPPLGTAAEPAVPFAGGGVLSCPLAVDAGARAYLHLANLGEGDATIRVSIVPARGNQVVLQQTLKGGAARTVRLHGRVEGRAAVVVEHSGGSVAASHSLWFARRAPTTGALRAVVRPVGGAAATCRSTGPGAVALPHLRTAGGREVRLLVYNAGAADADISIGLHTGTRVLRPERLSRRIIPPRRFRVFRLEDYAFNVAEMTAVIEATAGRVVAEALTVSTAGVALVEGGPPRESPIVISGASGVPATLGLAVTGEADTGLEAILVGLVSQGRATRVPPDLAPAASIVRTTPSLSRGPAAYVIGTTVGGPLAAGASWRVTRDGNDVAGLGATSLGHHWIAALGSPVQQSASRVVIVNPGAQVANVTMRILGGEDVELAIEPGRIARAPIASGRGPTGISVRADVPIGVMIETSASDVVARRTTTYATAFYATEVGEFGPVPVRIDPRAGVPAPLRRGE